MAIGVDFDHRVGGNGQGGVRTKAEIVDDVREAGQVSPGLGGGVGRVDVAGDKDPRVGVVGDSVAGVGGESVVGLGKGPVVDGDGGVEDGRAGRGGRGVPGLNSNGVRNDGVVLDGGRRVSDADGTLIVITPVPNNGIVEVDGGVVELDGPPIPGDWRPTLLAIGLLLLFLVFLATPVLRDFYGLTLLRKPGHYVFITLAAIIWVFILRFVWRARLVDRYVNMDLSPD